MSNPTVRHLVLNLLIAAEDGTLSAADAVKACSLFDISENNARVGLARLASADLIEAVGRGSYRLGPEGRVLGEDVAAWRDVEQQLRPWDGTWIAVLTGGLGKTDRAAMRARSRALALVGLHELERDVFIRPDNFAGGVTATRDRLQSLGLPKEAPVFLAREFDAARESRARRLWNVQALEHGYRESRQKLDKSLARLDRMSIEAAARESFLLGDQAIRQIVFDPMLPEPLAAVQERRAFIDAMRLYDKAGKEAWRRFLQEMQG
jgi:phenylacetic acid degradation operon negative regulatory protein